MAAVIAAPDDPALGGSLKALVIGAMQDAAVPCALREYVEREVVGPLAKGIGGPDGTARTATSSPRSPG